MSNFENHAVKALIYKEDSSILLQQRDYSTNLLFPGHWTFFGGLVEKGESFNEALERELVEELGCLPGLIQNELYCWEWRGEDPAYNHVFPVSFNVEEQSLILKEGQAMSWFHIDKLEDILLVPGLIENMPKIKKFLSKKLQTCINM